MYSVPAYKKWGVAVCIDSKPMELRSVCACSLISFIDSWQVLIFRVNPRYRICVYFLIFFFNSQNNFPSNCYHPTDMKWPRRLLRLSLLTAGQIRLVGIWLAIDGSASEPLLLSKHPCRPPWLTGLHFGLCPLAVTLLPTQSRFFYYISLHT